MFREGAPAAKWDWPIFGEGLLEVDLPFFINLESKREAVTDHVLDVLRVIC